MSHNHTISVMIGAGKIIVNTKKDYLVRASNPAADQWAEYKSKPYYYGIDFNGKIREKGRGREIFHASYKSLGSTEQQEVESSYNVQFCGDVIRINPNLLFEVHHWSIDKYDLKRANQLKDFFQSR